MRIKMGDGKITLIECSDTQTSVIRSWGKMEYNRKAGSFTAPIGDEILQKLNDRRWLPGPYAEELQRRKRVRAAVDRERIKEEPQPVVQEPAPHER